MAIDHLMKMMEGLPSRLSSEVCHGDDAVTKSEMVNHPDHYGGDTTYECINVVEAWGLGFCLGNVLKYIRRAGNKPGVVRDEDLKKALWYLQRELKAPLGSLYPEPWAAPLTPSQIAEVSDAFFALLDDPVKSAAAAKAVNDYTRAQVSRVTDDPEAGIASPSDPLREGIFGKPEEPVPLRNADDR